MSNSADWRSVLPGFDAPGVVVCDADALLGDACDALTSRLRSRILRAIDAGFLIALMSEQAYLELGWMYPKAARGRGVDEEDLRRLLEAQYLPRVRVVELPVEYSDAWVPAIDDVADPDDRAHAQLARLVAPSVVFSHDRDLRRPGYAPTDRDAYDSRLAQVAAVVQFLELQLGAAIGLNLTRVAASTAVHAMSRRSGARPIWVGLAMSAAAAAMIALIVGPQSRRGRLASTLAEVGEALQVILEDSAEAIRALEASPLVSAEAEPRLETQLASVLARKPGSTITEVRSVLDGPAPPHAAVKATLESHPSFARDARGHWTLGAIRPALDGPGIGQAFGVPILRAVAPDRDR